MTDSPVLLDNGAAAYAHQSEVDQVKRLMGIEHPYFDCWIYGFLENKNFNIEETVAKLKRRAEFEQTELSQAEITDWMMDNMRKGIIQVIGNDKAGRVTLYISTARDKPQSSRRAESRKNFDMFVSYATRLRPENKRCQLTMLINQDKASMWGNLDMTFQADIALRIAKFYPGCVDKMYICKMGRTLSALAKPIFSRLPAIVSDRIIIISDTDIKHGKLLELFDANVLPVALGGDNDCDKQENYDNFAITIRDYFTALKAAVLAGKSVKEWELENLRKAGYIQNTPRVDELRDNILLSNSVAVSNASHSVSSPGDGNHGTAALGGMDDYSDPGLEEGGDEDLMTCEPVTESNLYPQNHSIVVARRAPSRLPRDIFTEHIRQFEAIEGFFRLNISDMYDREWAAILKSEIAARSDITARAERVNHNFFNSVLPPTAQQLFKGLMWLCMTVSATYFFIGSLFIALLGAVTMTHIFFSMLAAPYYIFPYGCALLITSSQFCVFSSRGFDVAHNMFNGKLLQAFRAFGHRTLALQVSLSVAMTAGLFVLFCVMASRYDVLTGIQFSVAYGWIIAVCLTLIYHFVFAFGFKQINTTSYKHGSRVNNAETTLYILLDVDMDDQQGVRLHSPIEVGVIGVLMALTFAAGLSYMLHAGFFFLCATVVLQMILLPFCGLFFSVNVSASFGIIMGAVFYVSIFWITTVFTMGTHGWGDGWGNSVLASLFVMLFFTISSFVSIYGPWKGAARRWLFRIAWVLVLLHLIGCLVVLFVYNYRMGLFTFALTVHLLIMCFRTNDAANSYGIFTTSAVFAILLLACCMIGHMEHSELYRTSITGAPMTNNAVDGTDSLSALTRPLAAAPLALSPSTSSLNRFTPICLMRFPPAESVYNDPVAGGSSAEGSASESSGDTHSTVSSVQLDVVDMARFAKLGFDVNADAQARDLAAWFPTFRSRTRISGTFSVFVQESSSGGNNSSNTTTTILALRGVNNLHSSIESVTQWIGTYAVSFFSFLMPPQYLPLMMPYLSFVSGMSPLHWRSALRDHAERLVDYLQANRREGQHFYVVGHGPSGMSISKELLRRLVERNGGGDPGARILLFAAPPLLSPMSDEVELANYMMVTRTVRSVYDTGYLRSASHQVIPCPYGGKQCDRLDVIINLLQNLCATPG